MGGLAFKKEMFEKVAYEQWSGRKLYGWLNDTGFQTKTGKKLVLSNIYLILRNPFYYEFEFPVGSSNYPCIHLYRFQRTQWFHNSFL